VHRDVVAMTREFERDLAPDALRRAGDERDRAGG
jgi:hypothetical protein